MVMLRCTACGTLYPDSDYLMIMRDSDGGYMLACPTCHTDIHLEEVQDKRQGDSPGPFDFRGDMSEAIGDRPCDGIHIRIWTCEACADGTTCEMTTDTPGKAPTECPCGFTARWNR